MFFIFFFNDTATTEIYTLSLHDALPISAISFESPRNAGPRALKFGSTISFFNRSSSVRLTSLTRSEEHTSELQSRRDLVCRLLLEKKKKQLINNLSHLSKHIETVRIVLV